MPPVRRSAHNQITKQQLKLLLELSVLAVMLVFAYFGLQGIYAAEQKTVDILESAKHDKLRSIAVLRAEEVDNWFDSQQSILNDIILSPFVQKSLADPGKQHDQLLSQSMIAESQTWINMGGDAKVPLTDRRGFLVLYDKLSRVEYAVPDGWQPAGVFTTIVGDAFKSKTTQFNVILDENHAPLMAFAIPVPLVSKPQPGQDLSQQPANGASEPAQMAGVLLAVKPLPEDLRTIVQAHPAYGPSYQTTLFEPYQNSALMLVRPAGESGEQGVELVGRSRLDAATQFGLDSPGLYALKSASDGSQVWATGEVLKNAPWVIVATMPADADQDLSGVLNYALTRFVFAVLLIGGISGFIFMQKYRARKVAATPAKATPATARGGGELLHIIADTQTQAIMLFDRTDRMIFANAEAARSFGKKPLEVNGRSIDELLGGERAVRMKSRIREALQSRAPVIAIEHTGTESVPRIIQSTLIPVVTQNPRLQGAVLITNDDVTTMIAERERHETMLRQIIDTLVAIVDRRDPHAAGHSLYVGQISREIARTLNLDQQQVETAETAGLLMNFGKVLVSRAILTKTSPLTPEELQQVREGILASADILSIIDFDLPIVPTLRQVLERVDGLGLPDGRHGDNIIITARIVSVANAFVALISARAHRHRRSLDEALMLLEQDVGKAYDSRVVAALSEYITKRGGREIWDSIFAENAASMPPAQPKPELPAS